MNKFLDSDVFESQNFAKLSRSRLLLKSESQLTEENSLNLLNSILTSSSLIEGNAQTSITAALTLFQAIGGIRESIKAS